MFLETRYKGYIVCAKFLALLVQILTWGGGGGVVFTPHKSNVHKKAHEELRNYGIN